MEIINSTGIIKMKLSDIFNFQKENYPIFLTLQSKVILAHPWKKH